MIDIRKFNLVIFDEKDNIVDRFDLSIVDSISGLGFELQCSMIESEVEHYVTKIVQLKKEISFKITFLDGYLELENFRKFIEKNVNSVMCLEYTNTLAARYVEVKLTKMSFSELDEYKTMECNVTLKPLSPFFEKIDNDVKISFSKTGKSYNYSYPYSYGGNDMGNNMINNTYLKDIPINIILTGKIQNPIITLRDENDVVYNEIRFDNLYLLEGQQLIINSAQKKIWFDSGKGKLVDYYYMVNEAYDSYIRARALTISKIGINFGPLDTGNLVGSRRQYQL